MTTHVLPVITTTTSTTTSTTTTTTTTSTSTTTTLAATTTTRLVPLTSMVFPSIPTPSVPGASSVPPTLLTFAAVPVVSVTQPVPTLPVAALIQQSSIPVAPVPGPLVEGQIADITPAYTGSSSISTLVAAMLFLALGTLLLAIRSYGELESQQ